jgi:AcrR family transcriptional regulator
MGTRETLFTCALELFSARGYDAVGVQELVQGAGVTKPTLYHHFGNKRGVLQALLEQGAQPFLRKVEAAAHYTGDLTGNLQELTALYLGFAQTQPSFYRLLASCALAPPESEAYALGHPLQVQQLRLLERLFEAASHDHGNMQGRSQRYATSFLGLLESYARLLLAGDIVPDDSLQHDIVKHFSYGIYS